MKLPRTVLTTLTLAALTGFPASAFASVEITELMYDVSGSDTGREWIEVANTGTSPVDLSGYKLFEGETNHALTVVSGSASLAPGAAAVIVEDSAKFSEDWPSVSSTILKASFSLSNTGETLALKDATLAVVDQTTYDGTKGAAGDGNSLHRSGAGFVVGGADPGSYSQTIPPVDSGTSSTGSSQDSNSSGQTTLSSTATQSSQTGGIPAVTPKIATDATVVVGAGSFFTATAVGSKGEKIADARFIWNFGDGATAEGQNVFHTYEYPGKYSVMLSVASDLSAGIAKQIVQAIPAQIALMTESDGSAMLVNRSSQELTVGLWSITSGTSTFVIPTGTSVLGGQSVRFGSNVMHLRAGGDAVLQYPNGVTAVTALQHDVAPVVTEVAPPASPKPKTSNIASQVVLEPAPIPVPQESVVAVQPGPGAFLPFSDIEEPAVPPPPPAPVTPAVKAAAEIPANASVAASVSRPSSASLPFWEGMLGLFGLVVLGLSGVWYTRGLVAQPENQQRKRNSFSLDEFDIEE